MSTLTITQNNSAISIQQGGSITFSGEPGETAASLITVDNEGFKVLTGNNAQTAISETDSALLNLRTTGIRFGGAVTGLGTATISVASGSGAILDNTIPSAPVYYPLNWVGQTAQAENGLQWACIDETGTLFVTTTEPSHTEYRTCIQLARVSVVSGVITGISGVAAPVQQLAAQIWDIFRALGAIKRDLIIASSEANLKLTISTGEISQAGSNFFNDPLSPHEVSYPAFNTASGDFFRMVTQSGVGTIDTTDLPVGFYDVGGVVTAIPGSTNRATIFRVYRFPGGGNVRIYYGQTFYNSLAEAVTAVTSSAYSPVISESFRSNAILLGSICVTKGATALNDTNQAVFVQTNKFGERL